jgi:hypothetical protein
MRSKGFAALAGLALAASTLTVAVPASAHTTGIHDNCTKFNKVYPHGVGLRGARDRVKGSTAPVTNFKRANAIYWAAEHHNGDLDRDNDRVACEKH